MDAIRLTAHVDENGHIEIAERVDLPPGDLIVTVEIVTPEQQAAIDAQFDALLASPKSLAFLQKLGAKALAELDSGQTEELDPDTI